MKISSHSVSLTQGQCAPEISKQTNPKLDKDNKKEYDVNLHINIKKALSYTCGKLIQDILEMRIGNSDQFFWD